MEKLKTGDYIIRMPQVQDLLEKCLIGTRMFHEKNNFIYEILEVHYIYKKRNNGTWWKPIYEEVKVVEGFTVNSETDSRVKRGFVKFNPGRGEEFIEVIIPKRIKLLEEILKEIQYMKVK